MRLGYGAVSLIDELVFLAWRLEQHDQLVPLAPFLELRDKWLAELPPAASASATSPERR